jgi:hypothetical protein
MVESENSLEINRPTRRKKMTNSNNRQAVAVNTRVNAGALSSNHNETIAVKTRVNAGDAWDAK